MNEEVKICEILGTKWITKSRSPEEQEYIKKRYIKPFKRNYKT